MPSPILGRNFVAGEWLKHSPDFASTNPAQLAEIVGHFPTTSADVVGQAVAAARQAFPAWRRMSRIHRAECFHRLGLLIERDTDALATLMARECGKILNECRAEVVEGLHMVQYVFGTGRMPVGDVIPQYTRGHSADCTSHDYLSSASTNSDPPAVRASETSSSGCVDFFRRIE